MSGFNPAAVRIRTGGMYPLVTGAVYIRVNDTVGAPITQAQVSITGFNYMGTDYTLNVALRKIPGTEIFSFTSNLATTYYILVEAEGYTPKTGTVSMPVDFIAEYTYTLNPVSAPPPPPPGEAIFPWILIPQAAAALAILLL